MITQATGKSINSRTTMKRSRPQPCLSLERQPAKKWSIVLLLLLAVLRSSDAFCPSQNVAKSHKKCDHDLWCRKYIHSSRLVLAQGMNSDYDDDDYDDEGGDDDIINGKRGYEPDELHSKIDQQQEQINLLLSMVQKQQQQEKEPEPPKSPVSVASTFSKTVVPVTPQATVATASMNPLKAMLFIDGTWLYYSIHEREQNMCPIISKFGKGWQRRYYFDWTALPRVICTALQQQDPGWAVQSRPVEIVRASVFTSYKADTSPTSYRFQMFQEMSNANYDVHMMETKGRNEKCVDINIAVEMLHYATVPNAYDVALLLTGDKDFIPAMIRTRQKGRRVGLVSMKRGCNKALCEIPTDSNNNNEHNHNIRDYDVVWIDDYIDELIKPKRKGAEDNDGGDLTTFTFTKIVSDYISQSGMSRVNSRDIGRYLKLLTIGNVSILEELKIAFGGLRQFFESTNCFFMESKTDFERQIAHSSDRSYWVGLNSDADVTLMEAAKTAKLSPLENQFFDSYSLEPLEDKEFAYFQSLKLQGRIEASRTTPTYNKSFISATAINGDSSESDNDTPEMEELVLPEHLTQDYSQFTVPKLKEYCAEYGLKVSGKKIQLLDRIQGHVDQEREHLERQHDQEQRSRIREAQEAASVETRQPELPEHLTLDYSKLTMPKLKDFCRDNGLKVSGTKAELLDRIQAVVKEQKEALLKEHREKQSIESQPAPPAEEFGYLEELVLEYVKASGGKATSRELGRYLSANKASPTRLNFNFGRQRISALQELKEMHGSMAAYVDDHPHLFERQAIDPRDFEDPDDRMNKFTFYVALRQSPYSPPKKEPLQDNKENGLKSEYLQIGEGSASKASEGWDYLVSLVAEFVQARGGKANSRELGKYLSANKASPEKSARSPNFRISALQELKDDYFNMMGFLKAHSVHFERRQIDPDDFEDKDDPHNKYTFYVALKDTSPISLQDSPQACQEVS